MSFSFSLGIDRACAYPDEREQKSPLRFGTQNEALAFGEMMFQPPQSVKSWKVIEVPTPANCQYRKGQFSSIIYPDQ